MRKQDINWKISVQAGFESSIDVSACREGVNRDTCSRAGGIAFEENIKYRCSECMVKNESRVLLGGGGSANDMNDGHCC